MLDEAETEEDRLLHGGAEQLDLFLEACCRGRRSFQTSTPLLSGRTATKRSFLPRLLRHLPLCSDQALRAGAILEPGCGLRPDGTWCKGQDKVD